MTNLKDSLGSMHAALVGLEGHARKLSNQNFADIAKSAHGKVFQLMGHPDFAAVHDLQANEHGSANTANFAAELAALENSGDGQSERAKELRAHLEHAHTQKAAAAQTNFPGTGEQAGTSDVRREPFPA